MTQREKLEKIIFKNLPVFEGLNQKWKAYEIAGIMASDILKENYRDCSDERWPKEHEQWHGGEVTKEEVVVANCMLRRCKQAIQSLEE